MCSIEHLGILELLKDFFGVGIIYKNQKSARYRVTKLGDLLDVIIPHFTAYPLLSYKWVTYTLWVRCITIIATGSHSTTAGLMAILPIYAAMNRGASAIVLEHFPNLTPVFLPAYGRMFDELNPWWVTGYVTLWAQFTCGIAVDYTPIKHSDGIFTSEDTGGVPYDALWHTFSISRGSSEGVVMSALAEFFEGHVWLRDDKTRWDLNVNEVDSLYLVTEHFNAYPIPSIISAEFLVWQEFVLRSYDRLHRGERHSAHSDTLLRFSLGTYNRIIDRLDALRTKRRINDD